MEQQIPDILTQANRERFNRRMRVGTLLLGFLLISIMLYAAVQYKQQRDEIGKNYCYACGLYQGKQCETKYYTPQDLQLKSAEELRLELAEYNARKDAGYKDSFTEQMFLSVPNLTK